MRDMIRKENHYTEVVSDVEDDDPIANPQITDVTNMIEGEDANL